MITIYYFLFATLLLTAGPFLLLFKKKARAGISQKLGFIPQELADRVALSGKASRVWFHSVSVGEFNALYPLLLEFRKKHSDCQIYVSTTTATGQEIAKTKCSDFAEVFYFPFDLPWITGAYLDLISPAFVATVETEIWPGFINQCKKKNIPAFIINGRLSPRSAKGYKKWSFFFNPVLAKLSAILVQSQQEEERFKSVCPAQSQVIICGNIKLDGLKPIPANEIAELKAKLNISPSDFVIVGGSTHEGEESALLQIAKEHSCKLVLVPRHPERFERVHQLIQSSGQTSKRYSKNERFDSTNDVYLLDTIGQLSRFYSVCDIAFVGGTIANVGGHNLAEPCMYSVPVLCGPHIQKAREFYDKLSERGALHMANDVAELSKVLYFFKSNPDDRTKSGQSGYRFVQDSQGAVARTLHVLEQYLPECSPHKANSNCISETTEVGAR